MEFRYGLWMVSGWCTDPCDAEVDARLLELCHAALRRLHHVPGDLVVAHEVRHRHLRTQHIPRQRVPAVQEGRLDQGELKLQLVCLVEPPLLCVSCVVAYLVLPSSAEDDAEVGACLSLSP